MSLLSLTQIKARLGIADDVLTYDEALILAAPVLTLQFERYCDRGLEYNAATVDVHHDVMPSRCLSLWRYPIAAVTEVLIDGQAVDPATVHIDVNGKYLRRDGFAPWSADNEIVVTYAAGYLSKAQAGNPARVVPADLADAFARACGLKVGYGAGALAGAGGAPVKSVSLAGGAVAVAFDTATGGTAGAWDVSGIPPELHAVSGVLQYYRSYRL